MERLVGWGGGTMAGVYLISAGFFPAVPQIEMDSSHVFCRRSFHFSMTRQVGRLRHFLFTWLYGYGCVVPYPLAPRAGGQVLKAS